MRHKTKRPPQEGTKDLRAFLRDLSERRGHTPRKFAEAAMQGRGGYVWRAMARDAYYAKHPTREAA